MSTKKIIIALDGYSSTGKSTMARDLARALGYIYIDTGAMYRTVALYALENGLAPGGKLDLDKLREALPAISISFKPKADGSLAVFLGQRDVSEEIRTPAVNELVSPVAAVDFVRYDMVRRQQAFGLERGLVMDGRDVGTTIFPDAELKVFVDARPEIRAHRRYDEMRAKGMKTTLEAVLQNLLTRDKIDSGREVSPLCKAADARTLDNSDLTIAEQNALLLSWAHEAIARANA